MGGICRSWIPHQEDQRKYAMQNAKFGEGIMWYQFDEVWRAYFFYFKL